MNIVRKQFGFTLIEVLVTLLITAIGLLGLASLQIQTMNDQFESIQRSQVTGLIEELAARIRTNPSDVKAGSYTAGSDYGQAAIDCASKVAGAALDLCEWNNAILGAGVVTTDGSNVAAPVGALGCIYSVASSGSVWTIRVAIAWQGFSKSLAPILDCGANQYGEEAYRRAVFRDIVVR